MRVKARYYQQFDADHDAEVPGEGFGGWRETVIELSREHTAIVVMHAWDVGDCSDHPGWYRCAEFLPRAQAICRDVLPPLLSAVRGSGLKLFHVVSEGDYYKDYPGFKRAVALAGPSARLEKVPEDPVLRSLREFRRDFVHPGRSNLEDVDRAFERLDFPPEVRPLGDEGVAEDAEQLYALCREAGVNHLVYAGFAVNWCMLMSPGGMVDMSRRGVMCSVIRQATTAVENKETAGTETAKSLALWRIALAFGFVFDVDDFIEALGGEDSECC